MFTKHITIDILFILQLGRLAQLFVKNDALYSRELRKGLRQALEYIIFGNELKANDLLFEYAEIKYTALISVPLTLIVYMLHTELGSLPGCRPRIQNSTYNRAKRDRANEWNQIFREGFLMLTLLNLDDWETSFFSQSTKIWDEQTTNHEQVTIRIYIKSRVRDVVVFFIRPSCLFYERMLSLEMEVRGTNIHEHHTYNIKVTYWAKKILKKDTEFSSVENIYAKVFAEVIVNSSFAKRYACIYSMPRHAICTLVMANSFWYFLCVCGIFFKSIYRFFSSPYIYCI